MSMNDYMEVILVELLSPCGNYQAFLGCINAGADAVYLAGSKYGARAYADNFSDDEIIKAIHYAHLFDVKVYLTVNTLIKEREYEDVINYITPFYNAGLDACIVQDLGLISSFNELFPNMELHVSTQAFATGIDSVKFYKKLGAKRVVLARELSLNEIKEIKAQCDIELETFIHGAMCYSYSGQCLFSSCLGGRSGNRGRCAGPCRLEYKNININNNETSGYLLSMKDQCTIEILPDLIEAGIDSLKIEGRMKKPEYAAFVTAMYRKYIDLYKSDPKNYCVDKNDIKLLNSFYMRSEIGTGYYYQKNGKNMLSILNPAYSKTDDKLIEKVNNEYFSKNKSIKIDISVTAICNTNLQAYAEIPSYNIYVSVEGKMIEESKNSPVDENTIIKQFSKLGDTVFSLENVNVYIDGNCFIPVKELNEVRRALIHKLEESLIELYKENEKINLLDEKVNYVRQNKDYKNINKPIIKVSTLEQLETADSFDFDGYICASNNLIYELNDNETFNHNLIIELPYVVRAFNKASLMRIIDSDANVSGYLVNSWDEVEILQTINHDKFIIAGPGLYIWNDQALNTMKKIFDAYINAYELNKYEINELSGEGYLLTYGKIPLMQTANCIVNTTSECKKNKGNKLTYLTDRKNISFPVIRNCSMCYNTIFNSVPISLHEEVLKGKIDSKQIISFVDENKEEVFNILDIFLSKNDSRTISNYTKGYWKHGVE